MRIAIIGSGISGLASAYYLSKKHDVVVYEKNDYFGGHTRTKLIDYTGTTIPVDTGFIVFNHKNYPLLTQLFSELGIDVQKSDMSFGATINNGAFEWSGKNLLGVFAQKSNFFNKEFYQMLFDIKRFNKQATQLVKSSASLNLKLGDFLADLNLSNAFLEYYLLPMSGAIWSCSLDAMKDFPAKSFLKFFHNHGLLTVTQQPQWYSVKGGSFSYVKKILQTTKADFRNNILVQSVIRQGETNYVVDSHGKTEAYDKIIFCCHAPTILNILECADDTEIDILSRFKFQPNTVILHHDEQQMPKRKAAWSSWVYASNSQADEPRISVTYWMNNLQKHIPQNKPVFVTLNPIAPINPDKIFDITELEHPVFDLATLQAQNRIELLQGHKNCYYAGAWLGYGFHEDGMRAAHHVSGLINR